MTEQPSQPAQAQPFNIDLSKILPQIATFYTQFSWVAPMLGFKVPPEVDTALRSIATGKPPSPEEMQLIKNQVETMTPGVGEPVLTRQLAEDAWLMHKDGMGTREIAEQFTKDGSPCSHATIARWINLIDTEKRFGKIARLIKIGKIAGFIGIIIVAMLIGRYVL